MLRITKLAICVAAISLLGSCNNDPDNPPPPANQQNEGYYFSAKVNGEEVSVPFSEISTRTGGLGEFELSISTMTSESNKFAIDLIDFIGKGNYTLPGVSRKNSFSYYSNQCYCPYPTYYYQYTSTLQITEYTPWGTNPQTGHIDNGLIKGTFNATFPICFIQGSGGDPIQVVITDGKFRLPAKKM